MAESVEIRGLLNKLGRHLQEIPTPSNPFAVESSTTTLNICKSRGAWPGKDYLLLGHAYHCDCVLIGTEFTKRRSACFTLMLEQSNNRHRCVELPYAISYEGFWDVLSELERDWLQGLPDSTLLGPFFDFSGSRQRAKLAVWRYCIPVSMQTKELSLIT